MPFSASRDRDPGHGSLPWRGQWSQRGPGSPGGLATVWPTAAGGQCQPCSACSPEAGPALHQPGKEWVGQDLPPNSVPSVQFLVCRGPAVCRVGGEDQALGFPSTLQFTKASFIIAITAEVCGAVSAFPITGLAWVGARGLSWLLACVLLPCSLGSESKLLLVKRLLRAQPPLKG